MDNRLSLSGKRRTSNLRVQDLAEVALAITTSLRKYVPVSISTTQVSGAPTMVFESEWFHVSVLVEDWEKIAPYVKDNSFLIPLKLDTLTVKVGPDIVVKDPLYKRVLDVLTLLFPDVYPTSDL